ncbi:hypothetical protein ACPWR0_08300 [Pandoraea pneumonica]|uniref:hypothetical protein n=1 Tax=Pandoraea pneumonica TaxID=2508299 RepID=UPI003CE85891
MSITLNSLANNSTATMEYLRTEAFDTHDRRIGIRKDGTLAIYKGMQYLLHPNETHRALKFLKETKLSESAKLTFQQDKLRLSHPATQALVMTLRKHRDSYTGSPVLTRKSSVAHRASERAPKIDVKWTFMSRSESAPQLTTPSSSLAQSSAQSSAPSPSIAQTHDDDTPPPLPPKMNRPALLRHYMAYLQTQVESSSRQETFEPPVPKPRSRTPSNASGNDSPPPVPKPRPDLLARNATVVEQLRQQPNVSSDLLRLLIATGSL